jgi:asparagine N-glycosylation enzyme membrane subunit Stt3
MHYSFRQKTEFTKDVKRQKLIMYDIVVVVRVPLVLLVLVLLVMAYEEIAVNGSSSRSRKC